LPGRVKITLTVRDERGHEVPFTTEVRIAMQEPLNLRAVDAQQPSSSPGSQCNAKGQACGTGQQPCPSGCTCSAGKCS
jgi:hypothetical protein